jgi:hypothetical protein
MGNISDLTIPEFIYLDDQKVDMALWHLRRHSNPRPLLRKQPLSTSAAR